MFRYVLFACWALTALFVVILICFPSAVARIPHIGLFRPFFVILALLTIAYGLRRLYLHGAKSARS